MNRYVYLTDLRHEEWGEAEITIFGSRRRAIQFLSERGLVHNVSVKRDSYYADDDTAGGMEPVTSGHVLKMRIH